MSARHDDWRSARPGDPTGEPGSWWESWPWLASFLVIGVLILVGSAEGWI